MSTSTSVLADDLGPRGKRNIRIASVISMLILFLFVLLALKRFSDTGQLDSAKWKAFTDWDTDKFLLNGLVATLKAAIVSMLFAMVIGTFMALGRLARNAPVRWIAGIYVELFRALPLLLLILLSYIALPRYGFDYSAFWYLVAGLTAYNSAMLAEVFRSGILSLDRGQSEAAMSLGMGYWQAMFLIVIPQAVRRMVPSIVSQLVVLTKDTSLGYAITFEELLRHGRSTGEFYLNPLQTYLVVAVMYFVVCFSLSRLAIYLEHRQHRKPRAASPPMLVNLSEAGTP